MNTKENNKLIAEFMGITPNEEGVYHVSKHIGYDVENLGYNRSWDCLMPVVEKIKNSELYEEYDREDDINYYLTNYPKISYTYKAVVEFIKSHNQIIESDKKRLGL